MKKKLLALLIVVIVTLSTPGVALAAEPDENKNAAGVTPDSILYPVDKLIEDIREALTSNDVDKAVLLTRFAEERLAEAQVMIEDGKTKLAQAAADEYAKLAQEVNDTIQNADEDEKEEAQSGETTTGSSVSVSQDKDQDGFNDILEELIERNTVIQKNSINVLSRLLEKVPEQAKEALTAAIVKQVMRAEAVRDFVIAKKAYIVGRKAVKVMEKELNDAEKSNDQAKIDAAGKALDEANKKLEDLAKLKDEAFATKKNINTLIKNKLSEMNITVDADKKDGAAENQSKSHEKSIKDEDGKIKSSIKKEMKEEKKEQIKQKNKVQDNERKASKGSTYSEKKNRQQK